MQEDIRKHMNVVNGLLNESTEPLDELFGNPMGVLKSMGNAFAAGAGSAQAQGRLDTGQRANYYFAALKRIMGQSGIQPNKLTWLNLFHFLTQNLKIDAVTTSKLMATLGGPARPNSRKMKEVAGIDNASKLMTAAARTFTSSLSGPVPAKTAPAATAPAATAPAATAPAATAPAAAVPVAAPLSQPSTAQTPPVANRKYTFFGKNYIKVHNGWIDAATKTPIPDARASYLDAWKKAADDQQATESFIDLAPIVESMIKNKKAR